MSSLRPEGCWSYVQGGIEAEAGDSPRGGLSPILRLRPVFLCELSHPLLRHSHFRDHKGQGQPPDKRINHEEEFPAMSWRDEEEESSVSMVASGLLRALHGEEPLPLDKIFNPEMPAVLQVPVSRNRTVELHNLVGRGGSSVRASLIQLRQQETAEAVICPRRMVIPKMVLAIRRDRLAS